jgi:hypothetical protein
MNRKFIKKIYVSKIEEDKEKLLYDYLGKGSLFSIIESY